MFIVSLLNVRNELKTQMKRIDSLIAFNIMNSETVITIWWFFCFWLQACNFIEKETQA